MAPSNLALVAFARIMSIENGMIFDFSNSIKLETNKEISKSIYTLEKHVQVRLIEFPVDSLGLRWRAQDNLFPKHGVESEVASLQISLRTTVVIAYPNHKRDFFETLDNLQIEWNGITSTSKTLPTLHVAYSE